MGSKPMVPKAVFASKLRSNNLSSIFEALTWRIFSILMDFKSTVNNCLNLLTSLLLSHGSSDAGSDDINVTDVHIS